MKLKHEIVKLGNRRFLFLTDGVAGFVCHRTFGDGVPRTILHFTFIPHILGVFIQF